jgi:autotransporter-associated beta strand protein
MNNASTKSYSAPIFLESTHSGTVTIGSTSGQATFTGGVTGTHDLIVDATANVIFSTAGLNHTGNLTKNGASILSLGAANTFGGIALVQAGTLRLDHVNALQNATLDTGTSGAQAVTFNLAGANTYNLGGLQGADALAIGSNTISVGANNASTTFSGAISGTDGGLTKVGNGTLTLSSATNGYTGATQVTDGTLIVNGNISTSITTVQTGATLGGTGTVGAVTVNSGAFHTPGNSPGIQLTGNYSNAGTLGIEINGTTVGTDYDQVNTTGTVSLSGLLSITMGYTPVANQLFFILANDDTDAIAGTFSNAAINGNTYTLGGQAFQISYFGNQTSPGVGTFTGGNDVVLMAVIPEPRAALLGGLGMLMLLRRRRP